MHPGGARRPSDPSGTDFSLGPAPSRSRRTWTVPMHPEAHAELRRFRKEQGAIGSALLFPHARQGQRPDQPVSRHLVAWWLKEAFRRGKLQKPDGSLWPTFRRVWATERKHLRRTTGRSSSAPSSAIWTRSAQWSSLNGLRYRHQGDFKSASESVEPHGTTRSLTHTATHTPR